MDQTLVWVGHGCKKPEDKHTEADLHHLGKRYFDWKLCQETKRTESKHCTLIGKVVSHGLTIWKVPYTYTQPFTYTVNEKIRRKS